MDKKLKAILKKEKLDHMLPIFAEQGVTLGSINSASGSGFSPPSMPLRAASCWRSRGALPKTSELADTKVENFAIGKYAVTMEEWQGVGSWAIANGFGIEVGLAGGPKHPVTEIPWYDCVKWCNAKSVMEKWQ